MYVVDLSAHEFVRVSGPDSGAFLQGQVSCDMNQLGPDNSLRGALCNLKGRVIADFRSVRQGEDCLLQTGPGMAQKIIDVLAKYGVFSKVTIAAERGFAVVTGLLGSDSAAFLQQHFPQLPEADDAVVSAGGALLVKLSGSRERYELWAPAQAALTKPPGTVATTADWQQEDCLAGIVHVGAATSEAYTPQLLNYDISGVISFKKGCYTGQEVVARMYYRAQAKKRLYLLRGERPFPDDAVILQQWEDQEQPAEILALANGAVVAPQRHLALAVLSTEGVEKGAGLVLAGAGSAQLERLPLPYLP
ncbi:MAG: folate-binding protein [Pseudohongiellaceae bacterium]